MYFVLCVVSKDVKRCFYSGYYVRFCYVRGRSLLIEYAKMFFMCDLLQGGISEQVLQGRRIRLSAV